jgi:hypothetical protein
LKSIALIIVLSTLAAYAGKEDPTLASRMAAAHSPYQGNDIRRLTTNTPAFEEYAFNLMLDVANRVRQKWHLEAPELTPENAWFFAKPTADGLDGGIGTRNSRFDWEFSNNALTTFGDTKYYPRSFRFKDEASARLAQIKSKITAKEASAIAKEALHSLGLTEAALGLKEAPEVNQYHFQEANGKKQPLPCFDVTWRMAGKKVYAAQNIELTPVSMTISGISATVVEYHNSLYANPDKPLPGRFSTPTNYLEMLNLPADYLQHSKR